MKQSLAFLLALGVLLSFAGCKGNPGGKNTSSAANTTSVTSETGSADLSKEAKKITLCTYKNIQLDWNATDNQSLLNNSLKNYSANKKR